MESKIRSEKDNLLSAVAPLMKLLTLTIIGLILAHPKTQLVPRATFKLLSKLVFALFLPCLIFVHLGESITLDEIVEWWFVPLNVIVSTVIGCVLGYIVALICRPPPQFFRFTIIMTGFGNTGNLPIAIVGSVCHSKGNPFGPDCHRRGIAYVSFAQWVAVILVYTLVYHMMEPPMEYYEVVPDNEIEEEIVFTGNISRPLLHEGEWPGMHNKETEHSKTPFIARVFTSISGTSETTFPDIDLTEEGGAGNGGCSSPKSIRCLAEPKMVRRIRIVAEQTPIGHILQPPTIASLLAIIIGLVPMLKGFFFGYDAPLSFITDSLEILAGAVVPSVMLILGGILAEGPNDSSLGLRTPFLTFSRRVKTKQEGTGNLAEWNSKSEEKQCSHTTLRSHAAGSNCISEGSSSICSFKDQSASAVVLLEETEMPITEKDAGLKYTHVGGFGETRITSDGTEELLSHSLKEVNINNQNPVPSRPATDVPYSEDQSKSLMEAAATDFMKNSIFIQDDEQSDSAKFGSPVKEESGNELLIVNSEETNFLHDELVEGEHPCELVEPHTSSFMNNVESSKPLTDVVADNLLESQNSSTPSCPALADEETDGRSKELEWLEDLDRLLQGKNKNRVTCSFVEQAGINCGRESSGKVSPVVPTKSSLQSTCDQGVSSERMNGMTTPVQGNVFLTKCFEKQQHAETSTRSSLCTNFLGMSPPLNRGGHVDSIKDVQSTLLPSSSGVKDNVYVPNRHLPLNPSNENSFLLRHKQMVDNVITGTMMLNERQCSAMNMFRRYTSKWTEEELDFLWIGVRRHGISNWNAVLRDPKLHFSETRIAEDLAMQWDVEQKNLLNETLLPPPRFHRADYSSSHIMDNASVVRATSANQYGGSALSHACSEFPMLASDTKLSLGDVYHQKRNLFHSSGVGIANSLRSESSSTNFLLNSSSVGSVFAKSDIRHQMPISCENTRYDRGTSTLQQTGEKSIHEHQSAGPSAVTRSSNLPHWLQEVVNSTGPWPLLPVVSNTATSEGLLNDDPRLKMPLSYNAEPSAPPKDPRGRGILKRKSVGSGNKIVGSRINEVSSSLNESRNVGVLPLLGMASERATTTDVTITREKKSLSNQNRESDLVVIHSDASSEETISDDQNISAS